MPCVSLSPVWGPKMCLKEAGDMDYDIDYDIGRKFREMASMRLPGIDLIFLKLLHFPFP